MSEVNSLQSRIDAEIAANEQKLKSVQAEAVQMYEGRQERLQRFEKVCEELPTFGGPSWRCCRKSSAVG